VKTNEELNAALDVLMSGKQSHDCFSYLAEYFSFYIDNPEKIDPKAIKWITLALNKIASGDNPEQALGIKSKAGRTKKDFNLITRVTACMELAKRKNIKKSQAIQKTAEYLHKDPRHIQRILAKKIEIDYSDLDTKTVRYIASKGMNLRFLIANDDDEFFCW
jgi:hypothetical protein